MKGKMATQRDSNLELLRLFAMFMIVANHFATKSGLLRFLPYNVLDGHLFFAQFLASFGKLGVDVFVLISAWFMVGKPFRVERLLRVWMLTFIIGIGVLGVLSIAGYSVRSADWIRSLFPLTKNAYWFVTTYLPYIALVPFVLDAVQRFRIKEHGYAAGGLLIIYSLIPTLLAPFGIRTGSLYGYSELLWFLILAVLASYLKRAVNLEKTSWWKLLCSLLTATFIISCYTYICDLRTAQGMKTDWALWRHANSFFILIVACSLLLMFAKLRIGSIRVINLLASGVFGVYLIHDHPLLTRILWKDWVKVISIFKGDWYMIRSIGAICIVFVVCLLISCLINIILSHVWRLFDVVKQRL